MFGSIVVHVIIKSRWKGGKNAKNGIYQHKKSEQKSEHTFA